MNHPYIDSKVFVWNGHYSTLRGIKYCNVFKHYFYTTKLSARSEVNRRLNYKKYILNISFAFFGNTPNPDMYHTLRLSKRFCNTVRSGFFVFEYSDIRQLSQFKNMEVCEVRFGHTLGARKLSKKQKRQVWHIQKCQAIKALNINFLDLKSLLNISRAPFLRKITFRANIDDLLNVQGLIHYYAILLGNVIDFELILEANMKCTSSYLKEAISPELLNMISGLVVQESFREDCVSSIFTLVPDMLNLEKFKYNELYKDTQYYEKGLDPNRMYYFHGIKNFEVNPCIKSLDFVFQITDRRQGIEFFSNFYLPETIRNLNINLKGLIPWIFGAEIPLSNFTNEFTRAKNLTKCRFLFDNKAGYDLPEKEEKFFYSFVLNLLEKINPEITNFSFEASKMISPNGKPEELISIRASILEYLVKFPKINTLKFGLDLTVPPQPTQSLSEKSSNVTNLALINVGAFSRALDICYPNLKDLWLSSSQEMDSKEVFEILKKLPSFIRISSLYLSFIPKERESNDEAYNNIKEFIKGAKYYVKIEIVLPRLLIKQEQALELLPYIRHKKFGQLIIIRLGQFKLSRDANNFGFLSRL